MHAQYIMSFEKKTWVYLKKGPVFNLLVHLRFRVQACVSTNGLAGLEPGKILPPPPFRNTKWSRVG